MKLRIVIADDDTLIREYLGALLNQEADFEVVGLARNGEEALQLVRRTAPDLVLLDVQMPSVDGLAAAREIRAFDPRIGIAILTGSPDHKTALEGLDAGADVYLLKTCGRDEIVAALRGLADGQAQIATDALTGVLKELRRLRGAVPDATAPPAAISAREKDVLRLVVRGYANKEIARDLGLEVSTVKTHLHKAFEKLGVQDRTQAALLAVKHGWFEREG